MRLFVFLAIAASIFTFAKTSQAKELGRFEICPAKARQCQSPGTVGLACLGTVDQTRKIDRWRKSGDAMRVRNGRWEMYYANTDKIKNCARVLTVQPSQPRRDRRSQVRFCAGDDRNCQRPGMVGLSCLRDNRAVSRPTTWQYSSDAMRVVGNQWMMFYSHNNETYICESVVIGEFTHRSTAARDRLKVCRGNDRRCQSPQSLAVSCDIEGDGFDRPKNWHYNGQSMRVMRGQWQTQYPDQSTYDCKNVVVTTVAAGNRPPERPAPSDVLPSGAVILFDSHRCPRGWTRIGEVHARRSAVFGMSYCRME